MTSQWQKLLLHFENRVYLPAQAKDVQEANDLIDRYIHFYNHERIQNKMEWRR